MEYVLNADKPPYPAEKEPPREPAAPPAVQQGESRPQDESRLQDASRDKHRVRSPALRRSGNVLLMGLAAVCGVICGAVSLFSDSGAYELAGFGDSFLALFGFRAVYGGAFLLAEYLLGFFAFGEWLVWLAPLLCGMGSGAALAAQAVSGTTYGALLLVPLAVSTAAAVFGANASGELSALLLRLAFGDSKSVIMTSSAAKSHTLKFLSYFAAVCAAALFEAAVRISV